MINTIFIGYILNYLGLLKGKVLIFYIISCVIEVGKTGMILENID